MTDDLLVEIENIFSIERQLLDPLYFQLEHCDNCASICIYTTTTSTHTNWERRNKPTIGLFFLFLFSYGKTGIQQSIQVVDATLGCLFLLFGGRLLLGLGSGLFSLGIIWIVSGKFRETSGGIAQHIGMLGINVLVQERRTRVDHESLQADDASLGNSIRGGLGASGPSLCKFNSRNTKREWDVLSFYCFESKSIPNLLLVDCCSPAPNQTYLRKIFPLSFGFFHGLVGPFERYFPFPCCLVLLSLVVSCFVD